MAVEDRQLHIGKPAWLKTPIPRGSTFNKIRKDLRNRSLVTVCEEAKCPNIGECWSTNTATFMVLGDTCTRACRFCNVKTGNPQGWVDQEEPRQVAESCQGMGLKYVVITMVDRDDLPDGGADAVANVLEEVVKVNPDISIELLAGDFKNQHSSLDRILETPLAVYAHNIETVERLSPRVRDARASYRQSLDSLLYVKQNLSSGTFTKSALMLGLGEEESEVIKSLKDLREVGVDFLTIGQYMRPTKKHLPIRDWIHPDQFAAYKTAAMELGFKAVASSPLVRSSYKAREFYESAVGLLSESAK